MGLGIQYIDPHESFGMSGPWLGKLEVNGQELRYEYLVENHVQTDDEEVYAFNCFQPEQVESRLLGLFKIKNQIRKFRVLVFLPNIEKWFISKNYWAGMFLTRITKEQVFYTTAFHDDNRDMFPERSISLGDEHFHELAEGEIRKVPHNTL